MPKQPNGLRCVMCEKPLTGQQQKFCSPKCSRDHHRPPTGNPEGRPTVMTEETIKKLEEAFAIGCSDEEACFYAGISKQTLYNYQEKFPEFVDRKEALKNRPIMLARQTVVSNITKDSKLAMEFLKAKKRDEFATKAEVEHSGETAISITYVTPESPSTSDPADPDSPATPDLAETTG